MNIKEEELQFKVDNEVLSALSLLPPSGAKHQIFSFHGAGSSSKDRILYLLRELSMRSNLGALAFDFSGHGESSGSIGELSLKKREQQAEEAVNKFGNEPLHLIGSSMGGDTALRMLEYVRPHTIVLFAPALYTDDVYETPFGTDFTAAIRKPESWKQASAVLSLLEGYTGQLLIFIGEEDEVVPRGVIDLLDTHSTQVSRKEIVRLPGCDHSIHSYISENAQIKEEVIHKILDFING